MLKSAQAGCEVKQNYRQGIQNFGANGVLLDHSMDHKGGNDYNIFFSISGLWYMAHLYTRTLDQKLTYYLQGQMSSHKI